MTCVFLSSPYSHPNPVIREDRARMAGDACAWLEREGYHAISPIAQWHEVAPRNDMPTCANAWIGWNRAWLHASDAVALLMLDGWENSAGMAMELQWAEDKPQAWIEPHQGSFRVVRGALAPDTPHGLAYCDGQYIKIE